MGISGSGNNPGAPMGGQPASPTGIKGAPVMAGYSGSLAPQPAPEQPSAPMNLGGLQGQFNGMPPMQQFLMQLMAKHRGIDPLQATQNMDWLHQRHMNQGNPSGS